MAMAMVMALFAVMPMTALASPNPTAANSAEFTDALSDVDDGGIITLTGSFNHNGIFVISKSFTIDLAGNDLTVEADGLAINIENAALTIKGPGTLSATSTFNCGVHVNGGTLINDGAIINAIAIDTSGNPLSELAAVYAHNGGNAAVSSATATGANSIGVVTEDADSSVMVSGNVTATGCAISAGPETSVIVTGNVNSTNLSSGYNAVDCRASIVSIGGNLTAAGSSSHGAVWSMVGNVTIGGNVVSGDVGIKAAYGGTVTIDGALSVPVGDKYIRIGFRSDTIKTPSDFTTPTTKYGYYTYTSAGTSGEEDPSTVWVKELPPPATTAPTSAPPATSTPPGTNVPQTNIPKTNVPQTAGQNTTSGQTVTNVPKTGENNVLKWTALLIGSMLLLAVLSVVYFRKRYSKSNETR